MPHHDTHGSIPEPVQDFEERYSGGYYCQYVIIARQVEYSDTYSTFNECKGLARNIANEYQIGVDIAGILHNGDSEYIETVKSEVQE